MWITCGKVPVSYIDNPTDERHGYYNFHKEVHYAITDFINLYMYNFQDDFSQTAVQFTQQDYYFAVVHTTDKLLRQMTAELSTATQRNDIRLVREKGHRPPVPD
eukprot:6120176-Amphidinium_carterae.1